MKDVCLLALVWAGGGAFAQTSVNLRTQSRDVDFSAASSTKPSKAGIALPATCAVSETFFKTDAPAGQNLYLCAATNTWTLLAGKNGSGELLQAFGGGATAANDCAKFDSAGNVVSSGRPCGVAASLNDLVLDPNMPVTGGQFLAWDDALSRLSWFTFGGLLSITNNVIDVATESIPQYGASTPVPPACSQYGLFHFDTGGPFGGKLYYCNGSAYEPAASAAAGADKAIQFNNSSGFGAIAPNAATQRKFVTQSGDGVSPGAPLLDLLRPSDLPSMGASGPGHSAGAVPDPGASAGSSRFLREDGAWSAAPPVTAGGALRSIQFNDSSSLQGVSPNTSTQRMFVTQNGNGVSANAPILDVLKFTDIPLMSGSGIGHASGAVPDPGSVAGTTRFLREDGVWSSPTTTAGSGGMNDPGANGLAVRTSLNTTVARTLSAGSVNLVVTNGDGVAGNPTVDLGSNVQLLNANQSVTGDRTFGGKLDATGASSTAPFKTGADGGLPAACSVGQTYLASDAAPSRRLRICTATNTWTPVANDQGTLAQRPSTCAVGQMYFATDTAAGQNWYGCTATDTWTQLGGGAGGGGLTLSPTVHHIVEDFDGAAYSSYQIGSNGWSISCAGSGSASPNSSAVVPWGYAQITTGATNGNYCNLSLGHQGVGGGSLGNLATGTNWSFYFGWNFVDLASDAVYVSVSNLASTDSTLTGVTEMGVALDSSFANPGNLCFFINSSNAQTVLDTGQAATTGDTWGFKAASTVAGAATFQLYKNGAAVGSPVTVGSGQTLNRAIGSANYQPAFFVKTTTNAAKVVRADYFEFLQTGLAR